MLCKFCGAELNEESKFCVKCGKALSEEAEIKEETADVEIEQTQIPVVAQPASVKKSKKLNFISLLEAVIGLIFVIIGIITVTNSGVSVSSTSFGADFYTYCYRGIVACAELLSGINTSGGWIISALGLRFVFDGLKGLKK